MSAPIEQEAKIPTPSKPTLGTETSSSPQPAKAKAALVLLDLQIGILNRLKVDEDYVSRVCSCTAAARKARIPIVHVRTAFRPGHPEVNGRNFTSSRIASLGGFVEGDPAVDFVPNIVGADDIIVTKRRTGPFGSSDLEVVLRGLDVDSLVTAGVATSGAVLSTIRSTADMDYVLTVLKDLCLDPDEEVHRVLVEKVFIKQARVLNSRDWILENSGEVFLNDRP